MHNTHYMDKNKISEIYDGAQERHAVAIYSKLDNKSIQHIDAPNNDKKAKLRNKNIGLGIALTGTTSMVGTSAMGLTSPDIGIGGGLLTIMVASAAASINDHKKFKEFCAKVPVLDNPKAFGGACGLAASGVIGVPAIEAISGGNTDMWPKAAAHLGPWLAARFSMFYDGMKDKEVMQHLPNVIKDGLDKYFPLSPTTRSLLSGTSGALIMLLGFNIGATATGITTFILGSIFLAADIWNLAHNEEFKQNVKEKLKSVIGVPDSHKDRIKQISDDVDKFADNVRQKTAQASEELVSAAKNMHIIEKIIYTDKDGKQNYAYISSTLPQYMQNIGIVFDDIKQPSNDNLYNREIISSGAGKDAPKHIKKMMEQTYGIRENFVDEVKQAIAENALEKTSSKNSWTEKIQNIQEENKYRYAGL